MSVDNENGTVYGGGHKGEVGIAHVKDQECGEHPNQDIVTILDSLDNAEEHQQSIEQFNLEEVSKDM